MFSDAVGSAFFQSTTFNMNSAVYKASRGAMRVGAVAGQRGDPEWDSFISNMRGFTPQDIKFIDSMGPKYPEEQDYRPTKIADDPDSFFQSVDDVNAAFAYDAIVATGLAACAYSNSSKYFTGEEHFEAFKGLTFAGVTGFNRYDNTSGTRLSSSARFSILNSYPDASTIDSSGSTIRFKTVETSLFDGKWIQQSKPIFNDNTTNIPPDLAPVNFNYNYVGQNLRAVILTLSIIVLITSLGFTLWTYLMRHTRVIKASQPFFLQFISAGCFFGGVAIIFLSIDDEIAPAPVCKGSCIAMPWFLSSGWVIAFSALFTKVSNYALVEILVQVQYSNRCNADHAPSCLSDEESQSDYAQSVL